MEPGGRGARWLVVDADIGSGETTVAFLRSNGLQGGLAQSGRRVFELLRSGIHVDGILCDIALPRMDGFEIANEILNGPSPRALPIFLVTTKLDEEDAATADRIGCCGVLVKPLGESVLPMLAKALRASPPPVLVRGLVADEPSLGSAIAAVPDRPTLAPRAVVGAVLVTPPPAPDPRPRTQSRAFARCASCTTTYAIPDEIEDDRQLVLCDTCRGTAAKP